MTDILELSRNYLKANAAETGADVLIEELNKEVVRLRDLLVSLLYDPEPTLDEPDTDAEVICKMRALVREALAA